ncbi:MAG: DUF4175 family protein [Phycisphaerae bacterium]
MSITSLPPDELSAPLLAVAARQRRFRIAQAMIRSLGYCAVIALAAVLLLGSFPHLATPFRWCIAVIAWATMSWTLWRILRGSFAPVNLRTAAGVVETAEAHQEILLSAVEFSSDANTKQIASGELVDRVINRAGEIASEIDARRIVTSQTILKAAVICVPALLVWVLLWPLMPNTLALGVRRTIMPWSKEMPLSAMKLSVSPGNLSIGQGGNVVITARDHSKIPPVKQLHLQLVMRYADGRSSISSMTPTGPRSYRHTLPAVQTSFQYRILSRRGESRWYQVHVIARPAISRLTIVYHYPSYTHLPPHRVTGVDGTVTGIRGTDVSLTVHTTQKLARQSALHFAASSAGPATVAALNHVAGTAYRAVFTLIANTHYRIKLINAQHVDNTDDRVWPIVVHTDPPPVVHVTSPRGVVRARPDDVIPIRYQATDEYGITSLRVRIKVGNMPSDSYPIPLGTADRRKYSGRWKLHIADQLLAANEPHARVIMYRLVAEDNCLPAHQTGLSGEHEIRIDPYLDMSYQARHDASLYHQFSGILRKSIGRLQRATRQITQLQHIPPAQHFNSGAMRLANHSQNLIGQSARDLESAAARMHHGVYRQVATAIRSVTETSLHSAAKNLGLATFDNPKLTQTRSAQLAKAQQGLQAALNQLRATARQMQRQTGAQVIADSVRALARKQASVSKELSINPTDAGALAQQRQIENQIQHLVTAHPILQRPTQEMAAPQIKHLEAELRNIRTAQQGIRRVINAKLHQQQANQRAGMLATEQLHLNRAINQFITAKPHASALSNAPPISHTAMQTAVQALEHHHASAAHIAQKQIISQLQRAADRLKQEAAQSQLAAQRQKQAAANRNRAEQLARAAQQTQANTPAGMAHLENLAKQIAAEARKQAVDDSDRASRQLNQQARSQAQIAIHAATDNNFSAMQQALQTAGEDLSRSAQLEAQAVDQKPGPQQLSADAKMLHAYAARERIIAKQTAAVARELRAARQDTAESMRQSSKIASAISGASTQAKKLEQETALGSPQLAAAVAQARQQMLQAEKDQHSTNETLKERNHAEASIHQQAAMAHINSALADIQEGMRGNGHIGDENHNDHIPGEMHPNQMQARAGSHAPTGNASNQHSPLPTGLSEYQRLMQAASQLQRALAAGHAASQGHSGQAQAAASALSQAEQALAFVGDNGQSGQAMGAGSPMGSGGPALALSQGAAGAQSGGPAGGPSGEGTGIGADHASGQIPKSVAALGISPAQWVRLGALRQKQLLNTARQAIPPGYRQMVRDYYVKISRLNREH